MSKGNEPAYPNDLAAPTNDGYLSTCGLTKREYFAGLAMQGMLANPDRCVADFEGTSKEFAGLVAGVALEFTDALLAELERTA